MIVSVIRTFLDYLNVLNTMQLPQGNLGVPRSSMPQIAKGDLNDYVAWLETKGFKSKKKDIQVSSLKLAQSEVNKHKVIKMMTEYRSGYKSPIIVSKDGFVIDGSHRYLAQLNLDNKSKISTIEVNMNGFEMLQLSRTYQRAQFRNVSDAKISN